MAATSSMTDSVTEQTTPGYYFPWIVCLSAGLFFFYEFIQLHMFNSLSTHLMQDFSINAWQLGLLSNTYLMADVVFLLPAGIILDRFSVRRVILTAIMICVIGTLGFSLTHSIYLAGAFHFLSGIGNAFCFLSCILLTSRWFEPKRQALVIGIIVTMAMTGGWLAQTPLAIITSSIGWRSTLLLIAGLGAAIMLLIFAVVSDYPKGQKPVVKETTGNELGFWQGLALAAKNPQNWLCGLYTSLFNLPIMILGASMGDLYLCQAHNMSISAASTASGMLFIGTIIGAPLAGWISDLMERRKLPMMIGGIASLLIISYIFYGPGLTPNSAIVTFFMLGLFTSSQVISYPMINESNPGEIRGTALAIASVIIMGGAFVMTQVFVYVLQMGWSHTYVNNIAYYAPEEYFNAMLIFPGAFVVGLLACLATKETFCRKSSNSSEE